MDSAPQTPPSTMSHPQQSEYAFSRTSTFCTNLYSSNSTNSKTCGLLNNLPFHAQSPKSGQEGVNNKPKHSDDLAKEFLNLSGEISGDRIHDGNHNSSNMSLIEQMDLQILSEQLGIAITDNGDCPSLDVQRSLQLRVEEHSRYLQKIIEEQLNTRNSLVSSNQNQASKSQTESSDQSSPVRPAGSISSPTKDKDLVTEFKKRKVQ